MVDLTKHCTMQRYSRWNTSDHMLSEEKRTVTIHYRSSQQKCSVSRGILANFEKFTKTPTPELQPATLLKKIPWYKCFPMNYEIQNTSGRLLLSILIPSQDNAIPISRDHQFQPHSNMLTIFLNKSRWRNNLKSN